MDSAKFYKLRGKGSGRIFKRKGKIFIENKL